VEACDVLLTDGLGGVNLGNVRQVAEALGVIWDEELIRKVTILARWRTGENLKDLMDESEQETGSSEP